MSSIDPSSQAHLDSILKKLGVNKQEDQSSGGKESLGQAEFLQLMTTQLQNQDPFAPMAVSYTHLTLPTILLV